VRITGKTESAYISKDTPMVQYLNVSFAIEGLRRKAEEKENHVDNQGNPLDARVRF
jgi:polyribonucleotide 5'-hydroxyl-kinase